MSFGVVKLAAFVYHVHIWDISLFSWCSSWLSESFLNLFYIMYSRWWDLQSSNFTWGPFFCEIVPQFLDTVFVNLCPSSHPRGSASLKYSFHVLLPLQSKWPNILQEIVKYLNFNIWYVLYVLLVVKYGFMRFSNHCILFFFHVLNSILIFLEYKQIFLQMKLKLILRWKKAFFSAFSVGCKKRK